LASRRTRKYKSLSNYLESLSVDAKELRIRNDYSGVGSTAINSEQFADDVQLIDKTLQSNNYVSGASGWAISGTGNAEFENAYVRGDINATSGTIGYWHISQPTVQRTFGNTTLFGTFLESADHGYDDLSVTTGSYVSLFKSYDDDEMAFSAVSIDSNFVTLTIYDHRYGIGDSIIVNFNDAAYSAYETTLSTLGTIVAITPTTITYDVGTVNENGAGDIGTTAASGDVLLYIEDVAGLYLRDYGKREFDYGYFSNKGVAYRSADIVNLVHNSSFEWTYDLYDPELGFQSVEVNQPSLADWTSGGGTFASYDFIGSRFDSRSAYGAELSWTTSALSTYVDGTISYLAADQYHLLSEDRALGLGFEMFFDYTPVQKLVTTNPTATTTRISITTTTAHGYAIGDLVYIDFNVYNTAVDTALDATNYPIIQDGEGGSGLFSNLFKVMSITSTTIFTITNTTGVAFSGTTTRVAQTNDDGTSRTQAVYKVYMPALDLSEIRFKFSNSTTTSLSSVLSADSLVPFNDTDGKYIHVSPSEYMPQYLNNNQTMLPLDGVGIYSLSVQGSLLEAAYVANDPTGYAAKSTIKIQLPGWLYKQTTDTALDGVYNFTSTTKLTDSVGVGYVLDSVFLSTYNKPFYKIIYDPATSTRYEYNGYDPTGLESDGSTYGLPTYPSIRNGLTWMDINLDSQEFTIQNVDELKFSAPEITKDMASGPYILPYSAADYSNGYIQFLSSLYPQSIDIDGADNQGIGTTKQSSTYSGGLYSYYDANSNYDIGIQAATTYEVGDFGSSSRLKAYREFYTADEGIFSGGLEASVRTETWSKRYGYKTVSSIQASVMDGTGNIFGSLEPEAKVSYIQVMTSGLTLATLASSITMKADSILVNDSGALTTGITAATGWTLGAYTYRRNSNMVQASITVTKATSAITVPAGGNFTDSTIATMPAGFRPSFNGGTLSTAGANGAIMTGYVTTAGAVVITATSDAATISIGQVLNISVIYMVA
jgi:hypothetical protein